MARKKIDGPSRQLFAKISEDIYLAAKSRSASRRISMRELLEEALTLYLGADVLDKVESHVQARPISEPTIWEDEYLSMQADRPIGSPLELSKEESRNVARRAFE